MKIILRRASAMLLSIFFILTLYAENLPVTELLGSKYYVYECKKGDTLFGIARANGWDDEELKRINPTAISPLKKGVKIYYPVNENTNTDKTKKISGSGELRHIVKRGETVYSISKSYGVPVETIYKLNPTSKSGIQAGSELLIRSKKSGEKSPNTGNAVFYTIKPGDTLYSVGQAYNVSVSALMDYNPGVSESNFKAGEIIKLPPRGTGVLVSTEKVTETSVEGFDTYEVKKDETWNSVAQKNGISEETLKEANPELKNLKNKQVISIPIVKTEDVEKEIEIADPREITNAGIKEIYDELHLISDSIDGNAIKVAVILESGTAKKDVEFTRGMLAGINKLKKSPYKISLKVINGVKWDADTEKELNEFNPTIVFNTYDKQIPENIIRYANENKVYMVNVFDLKSTDYTTDPYIVQMLTPSTLFNENIAAYLYEKYGDYKIVFAGDPDSDDMLAESLRKTWDSSMVKKARLEDINPSRFDPNGKYIIYGTSVKKNEIEKLLGQISDIKENSPFADIITLGRPNWILYDESLSSELHKANAMIPSRFYIDKDSENIRKFNMQYKSLFNRTPAKSVPLYAATGYDASLYFIPQLASNKGDLNNFTPNYDMVQSAFDLKRVSNWGGFLNPPVFLINFTPFNTVDKKVVNYEM